MLRKILSLVLNCEKEKASKDSKETRGAAAKYGESKPSTKVDTKDSSGKIPDPWYN
jgi:hypothetical protein